MKTKLELELDDKWAAVMAANADCDLYKKNGWDTTEVMAKFLKLYEDFDALCVWSQALAKEAA